MCEETGRRSSVFEMGEVIGERTGEVKCKRPKKMLKGATCVEGWQGEPVFDRLKNTLFWRDEFNKIWQHGYEYFFLERDDFEVIGSRWGKRIEEKKCYWRDHGKTRKLTPARAVFEAFLDIANELFSEYHNKAGMERVWKHLGRALSYAAPHTDEHGKYIPPDSRLPPRWKIFYEQYKTARNLEIADKKAKFDEVSSYRFPTEELAEAWQLLCDGKVPDEARRIWQKSGPPRSTAHAIASRAGVSVRDFVFWMVVFRQQGMMSEQIVNDERLYCNSSTSLSERDNLPEALQRVLKNLAFRL